MMKPTNTFEHSGISFGIERGVDRERRVMGSGGQGLTELVIVAAILGIVADGGSDVQELPHRTTGTDCRC